jgi:hypothetical protein
VFNKKSSRYFIIKRCGHTNGKPRPPRQAYVFFMQKTHNKENTLEIGAFIVSCMQLGDGFIKPQVIDS